MECVVLPRQGEFSKITLPFFFDCEIPNNLAMDELEVVLSQSDELILYPAGNNMFKVNNRNTKQGVKYVQS